MIFLFSFDWRNVNGKNFVTSVKTQGPSGNCVAFGTIGAVESVVQIEHNESFDCDLSEAYLFFCGDGNFHSGWIESEAAEFITNLGMVDECCFPYIPKDMDCGDKESIWKQRLVTVKKMDMYLVLKL